MERVAFLVERTGERIPCLLNPDSVVARRSAGIRSAGGAGHRITGLDLADDPLIFTGGGRTEFELDLLFDTSLLPGPATVVQNPQSTAQLGAQGGDGAAGATLPPPAAPIDVRTLTGPLWRLAENTGGDGGFGAPPLARFVWGKSWNVLGVITAIAERVEQFDPDGTPGRSWLRLRMLRVPDANPPVDPTAPPPSAVAAAADSLADDGNGLTQIAHEVMGDGSQGENGGPDHGERLESIAARYYPGQPWMWLYLAMVNDVDDAPWAPTGAVLQIPPAPDLGSGGHP